jgi:hypothetical protein
MPIQDKWRGEGASSIDRLGAFALFVWMTLIGDATEVVPGT